MSLINKFLLQWKPRHWEKELYRSFMTMTTNPTRASHCLFINPAPDEEPKLNNTDVIKFFGERQEYSTKGLTETIKEQKKLLKKLPQSASELPIRKMKDSFASMRLPLKTDVRLRDRYLSVIGQLRIGRILEDMDIFAVYSGYMHINNPKSAGEKTPYVLVTALVDSIIVNKGMIQNDEDIRLSAHVSYAGKSSLEVCLIVDQKDNNGMYRQLIEAIFVLVARDSLGIGPALVNPLVGETAEENAYLDKAKTRQSLRRSQADEQLIHKPPNAEEREIIHKMFMDQTEDFTVRRKSLEAETSAYMAESKFNTVFLCHPQYRNSFHKVFGGFIMRQGFELALTNVFIFAGQRPRFIAIDDIKFLKPVDIGSFLRFTSKIGYIEGNYIHTPVYAEIIDPTTGSASRSNDFQFTFKVDKPKKPLPSLLFESYSEAMIYLDSRRHFKKNMAGRDK